MGCDKLDISSPGLNPMENLLLILKNRIQGESCFKNKAELRDCIEKWKKLNNQILSQIDQKYA